MQTHTHKHRSNKLIALLLCWALISPVRSQDNNKEDKKEDKQTSLGIATDFGDVLIENLGIGQSYNLRELAGTPLKVHNRGTETIDLTIDVHIPGESMISERRKNMGVLPIPSLAWISVSQNEFLVPGGETAFTDVIITIPDDPALYGKMFQGSIHSRSTGRNFMQVGVWSHFILGLVESPEKQAEMEKNRKRGIQKRADYSLFPDKVYIEKLPRGRPYDVRKENKRTIKITNIGDEAIQLSLKVVPVADTPISLQAHFEQGNPPWLKPKSPVIDLDVDSVVDPKWVFNIPDDPSLSGKKLMFIVKVEPVGEDVVGYTFYGRFYVVVE